MTRNKFNREKEISAILKKIDRNISRDRDIELIRKLNSSRRRIHINEH